MTKCHYKMLQQIVTKNQGKITAFYLFFISCSDESYDFVVTYLLPKGEKNVMTSHNVAVADAYGSLPN